MIRSYGARGRPAERAVRQVQLDVPVAKLGEDTPGRDQELGHALDADQRVRAARPGSRPGSRSRSPLRGRGSPADHQLLGHQRDDVRLGDGLATTDRERDVLVGLVGQVRRHKRLARTRPTAASTRSSRCPRCAGSRRADAGAPRIDHRPSPVVAGPPAWIVPAAWRSRYHVDHDACAAMAGPAARGGDVAAGERRVVGRGARGGGRTPTQPGSTPAPQPTPASLPPTPSPPRAGPECAEPDREAPGRRRRRPQVARTSLIARAVADAAQRSGAPASDVTVESVTPREWSDRSLGCPKPGVGYDPGHHRRATPSWWRCAAVGSSTTPIRARLCSASRDRRRLSPRRACVGSTRVRAGRASDRHGMLRPGLPSPPDLAHGVRRDPRRFHSRHIGRSWR